MSECYNKKTGEVFTYTKVTYDGMQQLDKGVEMRAVSGDYVLERSDGSKRVVTAEAFPLLYEVSEK